MRQGKTVQPLGRRRYIDYAIFRCEWCQSEWPDELPPHKSHRWPRCCEEPASLLYALVPTALWEAEVVKSYLCEIQNHA